MSASNLLTGIAVGVFTLAGVWLKDCLDNKKLLKRTTKQKAIEAYALTNKIMHCHHARTIICEHLIRDKNYDYSEFQKRNPDITSDMLEKLELNIIENFYDLKPEFDMVNMLVIEQLSYLLGIMCDIYNTEFQLEKSDFDNKKKQFGENIIKTTKELRDKLNEKYINKNERRGIINLCQKVKRQIKDFIFK